MFTEVTGRITDWMATRGFQDQMLRDAYLNGLGQPIESPVLFAKLMKSDENMIDSCVSIERGLRFMLHLLPKQMEYGSYNLGRWFLRATLDQSNSRMQAEILQLDIAFISESASFARAKGIVVDLIESLEIGHSSTRLRPIKLPFLGPAGVVEVHSNYSTSDHHQTKPVVVGCAGVIRPEVWESLELDPDRLGIYAGLSANILGDLMQKGAPK